MNQFINQAINITHEDIPGGPVDKNPPANAGHGDTGSIPGPGRSHVPQSNQAAEPQLLSPLSRAQEHQLLKPMCLEPVFCNKRSQRSEKPVHHNERKPSQQQRLGATKNK